MYDLKAYLPTTKKELQLRGWDEVDVILFSGDAYIDHPAFGAAVIGRILEAHGYRVAIVPQPDWRGDHRDFTKLGRPRLFFAVTSGSMDSMVNHYTAAKRLRSDDAYTPEGRAGMRPDYCTITYCNILKKLYPDVPIVVGGIEASMRRLTHYDYWSDRLMPSILVDSKADILVYGMGEKQIEKFSNAAPNGSVESKILYEEADGDWLNLQGEDRKKYGKSKYNSINSFIWNIMGDDILDVIGSAEKLGKPIGSDDSNNKSTYVSLVCMDNAQKAVLEYSNKAKESIAVFGEKAEFLNNLVDKLIVREN